MRENIEERKCEKICVWLFDVYLGCVQELENNNYFKHFNVFQTSQ